MPAAQQFPARLRRLIESQEGAVSVKQCLSHGLSYRVVARLRRHWLRVGAGIYIDGEPTWKAAVHAAVLYAGTHAAIGGAAACFLHGIIASAPQAITVWAPHTLKALTCGPWRITPRRGARARRGSIGVTDVEDSLLDHANTACEDDVIEAVTRALSQGYTTTQRLLQAMNERQRLRHRVLISQVCEADGVESVLEWRYRDLVHRRHRLPAARFQVTTTAGSRYDVLWQEYAVGVELDGRSFHDINRDARRDNQHALDEGITTLRFTWHQVMQTPCDVAATVAGALRARGWLGDIRKCKRCQ